jgi:hypothetical protein
MNIHLGADLEDETLDVEIVHQTRPQRGFGKLGWYWHDSARPPVGPFASQGAAIRAFADAVENGTLPLSVRQKKAAQASNGSASGSR